MKLSDFCQHSGVNPSDFQTYLQEVVKPDWQFGPWVAGGSIRRLLTGGSPFESDIDVFFASETQKDAWLERIKAAFPEAVSLANAQNVTLTLPDGKKLQAIHVAYYETPQAVIDSFDYTICQLVTDGERLETGEFTLWDLARKRLVLHRLEYPVPTMRRMIKYVKQGFYACPGMMTDLLTRVVQNPALINQEILYFD